MYYELMMKYEERKQNKTIEMNDEVIGLKQQINLYELEKQDLMCKI